ncbi:hypothetical protein AMTR_s00013p00223970 [Amborella trichopoda]|uniref:F-box domain-containing protein n=1 Tax=Amborella trichopoda TaxID=13333 RepID=W1PJ15_AMBTC|nr:hypothetical protein AMTR_s00013p00223970 [Amborella trichopoda]
MVERCSMPPESATSDSAKEEEPQDTYYSSYLPPLTDEVLLLILARTPFFDHPTLRCLNRRHRTLLESGDLYRTRQAHDLCHPIVFMSAGGGSCWFAFSPDWGPCRRRGFRLPHFPSNNRFYDGDKESTCAESHLLVSSLDPEGPTVWRFELGATTGFRGPKCSQNAVSSPRPTRVHVPLWPVGALMSPAL